MVIFILRGWSPTSEGAPSPEGVRKRQTAQNSCILRHVLTDLQTIDRLVNFMALCYKIQLKEMKAVAILPPAIIVNTGEGFLVGRYSPKILFCLHIWRSN